MKRIAILLLVAAPACAAREASERPPMGPAPVARPATTAETASALSKQAPPSIPLRAFTNAPDCAGWPTATEIGVEKTKHGAALVFANADHIVPLRTRVAAMPEAKTAGEAVRLDNVDDGIRLVYEGTDASVTEVHESARVRARELRRMCGLARYLPSDDSDKDEAKPSREAAPPPPSASKPATKKSEPVTKPKTDDKPKTPDKPKAGDKPKTTDKPGTPPAAPTPKPREPEKPKPPAPPKPGEPKPPPPPKPPESPFPRA